MCQQFACARVSLEFNRRVREELWASSLPCERGELPAGPPCYEPYK